MNPKNFIPRNIFYKWLVLFCMSFLTIGFISSEKCRNVRVGEPVALKVDDLNKEGLKSIKLYRISANGNPIEIQGNAVNEANTLFIDFSSLKGKSVKKVLLCIPREYLNIIQRMDVTVGKKVFSFGGDEIRHEWKGIDNNKYPNLNKPDSIILELPHILIQKRFISNPAMYAGVFFVSLIISALLTFFLIQHEHTIKNILKKEHITLYILLLFLISAILI